MAGQESRNHDEEEYHSGGDGYEEMGVEADEGVDREERKCMGRVFPGEKTDEAILEDKGNPDSARSLVN